MSSPRPFLSRTETYPSTSSGDDSSFNDMDSASEGVSVRPMRLKVLYTFDDESKTNCLARWPHILDVRTAYIDETTQIGVIELKTCIQAIVSARTHSDSLLNSPELVAKLGQDYTVYAYDYSEYETPLVGQGLLSWVLASTSPTPDAPAHQSRTIVTGRVSRSIMGLFSKGAQETLEVKLRLVPVPTSMQSDYLSSMQRYRELSSVIPAEFDAQAWTNFIQANPGLTAGSIAAQSGNRSVSPMDRSGLEKMHQMLSEGSTPRDISSMQSADPFRSNSVPLPSGPGNSRTSTPAMNQSLNQQSRRSASQASRPSSRLSMHQPMMTQPNSTYLQRRESISAGYGSSDDTFEEGPAKKRAKVMRADWPGKSNLNIERQPDSLRVAASTAASVRIHRPIAVNPALIGQGSNEEPVRPPTPIPKSANETTRRSHPAPSSLRCESQSQGSSTYVSPYGTSQERSAEVEMTSPEDSRYGSPSGTPANIPSSPPVMNNMTSLPSSPVLPPFPRNHDSGFMSGSMDDVFEDKEGMRPIDYEDADIFSQYTNQGEKSAMPGTVVNLPPKFPSPTRDLQTGTGTGAEMQPLAQSSRKTGSRPASRAGSRPPQPMLAPAPFPRARQMEREQSVGTLPLPPIPASDPVRPHPSILQRSQTWAGDVSEHAVSDAPTPAPTIGIQKPRSGSSAKRVKAVQSMLESAISRGQMPPYCDNCGAIETPTWRKAYAKVYGGSAENVKTSTEEGAIICWEALEKDEEGIIKLFKVYKRSTVDGDEGFLPVLLCNPCGLWFHKYNCMRPEAKWNKNPKDPKEKKKRPSRPRSQRKSARARNAATVNTDASTAPTDGSSPADGGDEATQENECEEENDNEEPQLPPQKRPRANSLQPQKTVDKTKKQWDRDAATAALNRSIQSSPARLLGSESMPVGLDLTPKPTRRLLFPSPRKDGVSNALVELPTNTLRRSPRLNSKQKMIPEMSKTPRGDKENHASPGEEDGLNHLFDDNDDEQECPATPSLSRRSARLLTKTPSKTTSSGEKTATPIGLSPSARRLLHSLRTPKASPSKSLAPRAEEANMPEMTPFTLQIHQLLSEGVNAPPAKGDSDITFEFPDLPSLKGSSPNRGGHMTSFDFSSHFDPQDLADLDLLSTDMPMPSSPPPAFFGLYEDPVEPSSGLWSDYGLPEPNMEIMNQGRSSPPKKTGLIDSGVDLGRRAGDEVVDFSALIDDVACAGGERA